MHLTFRNVNEAFNELVKGIAMGGDPAFQTFPSRVVKNYIPTERKSSRVGDTLQVTEPVIVTYEKPRERVLFNAARDANPFFHLFESLWMLAGHNDVAPLQFYSSNIAEVASDDGKTFNGAYGYRWRQQSKMKTGRVVCSRYFCHEVQGEVKDALCRGPERGQDYYSHDWINEYKPADQLNLLIDHLRNKPESRRAVLQMWNVEDDLLKIDVTKDVCCNTAAYFAIRYESDQRNWNAAELQFEGTRPVLDMTVTNRSNDMIWGMLGANVVHFSFLQEYIACALGVEVGVYNQFTNNLHVYLSNWKPKEWLAAGAVGSFYYAKEEYPAPLFHHKESFDGECERIVENYADPIGDCEDNYTQPFLRWVALPMFRAFAAWKLMKNGDMALSYLKEVQSPDWKRAGTEWIQRRIQRKAEKHGAPRSRGND